MTTSNAMTSATSSTSTPAPDKLEQLKMQRSQLLELHASGILSTAQCTEGTTKIDAAIDALTPVAIQIDTVHIETNAATAATVPSPPPTASTSQAPADHNADMLQIAAMAESLAKKLESDPKNIEGFMMLGRTYLVLEKFKDASGAFKKAMLVKKDDPDLLADYAEALARDSKTYKGEPLVLAEKALALSPKNIKALMVTSESLIEKKEYPGAIKLLNVIIGLGPDTSPVIDKAWTTLESTSKIANVNFTPRPPQNKSPSVSMPVPQVLLENTLSPKAGSLFSGLSSIKPNQLTNSPNQLNINPSSHPTANSKTVGGTVTLEPLFKNKVSQDDTLFVFARAASGSRMPLAIIRQSVKDLPLSFTLDDSTTMSPTTKLSDAPNVIIGARISKSGNAIPQPGDLFGETETIKLGSNKVSIDIKNIVK